MNKLYTLLISVLLLNYYQANAQDDSLEILIGEEIFEPIAFDGSKSSGGDTWNGAWVDYNGDGKEDFYICEKGSNGNYLYRNDGNNRFTKITNHPLVNFKSQSSSCSWADFNNDGRLDVFITNVLGKSLLFKNNGSGNFEELSNSGITDEAEYFHGSTWFDYDNDGFVDLLVTNYFETHFHQLYHNNGNNTFTRIYNTPITQEGNRSMAPACADYNNDGLVDVFIPNGNNTENSLFQNIGNGQFIKVTNAGEIVSDKNNSVGAAWGDYNNDGWMDLYVANASNQNNCLYKNNKNGTFTKITNSIAVQEGGQSHCVSWADIDQDADLDLYVTNDIGRKFLYINDGSGNFTKNTNDIISTDYGLTFGHVWADYNKDGALDLLAFTHSGGQDWLFQNTETSNKWVEIKLIGTNSNKSAIGAVVRVKSNGLWQLRQVNSQSGFGSQNSLIQHFGLTNSGKIDSIEVKWPSGYKQYLKKQNAGAIYTITEDASPLVKGYAFNDLNKNGNKDANESVISNMKFVLSPSNLTIVTDINGYYEVRIRSGVYSYSFNALDEFWKYTSKKTLTVSSNPSNVYTFNLPLESKQVAYDLTAKYSTTAWRRGFKNQSSLQITNKGNVDAYNIRITLSYPTQVKLLSYLLKDANDDIYNFNIDTLLAGEVVNYQLTDSVTLDANVGDVYPVGLIVEADGTDVDYSDNEPTEEIEIVGPIDPNDILVSPKGEGALGYINKEQILTYKIRFQNVGTYECEKVTIVNQLSQYLDGATLKPKSASHNYQYSIDNNGKLEIVFDGIKLKDSTTNESESHGYFEYTISPVNTVIGAESIYNSASIMFDYEDGIETNKVLNTIRVKSEESASLLNTYPNPSTGIVDLSISLEFYKYENSPTISQIFVFDVYGNLLLTEEGSNSYVKTVDLTQFNKGSYYFRAIDSNGSVHVGKVVIQ